VKSETFPHSFPRQQPALHVVVGAQGINRGDLPLSGNLAELLRPQASGWDQLKILPLGAGHLIFEGSSRPLQKVALPVKKLFLRTKQIVSWIRVAVNCAWLMLTPQHVVSSEDLDKKS